MGLQREGKIILQYHKDLLSILSQIPLNRSMYYREDMEKGHKIGKPRFIQRDFQWKSEDLSKFHNHLQNLWQFFSKYSYWFDSRTKNILNYEERSMSNKSVKFLLEKDVWNTSEVYGAYLIEEIDDKTIISYYRFDSLVKSFKFPTMSYEEREKWIIQDAKNQILSQLSYLWDHLTTEIEVCMEEQYHKYPPMKLKSDYLHTQLQLAKSNLDCSPESTLLMLGRMSEIWLLQALNLEKTGNHYLVSEATNKKLLRKTDARFFSKMRHHYNYLKHSTIYNVRNCPLEEYLDKFESFLKS